MDFMQTYIIASSNCKDIYKKKEGIKNGKQTI